MRKLIMSVAAAGALALGALGGAPSAQAAPHHCTPVFTVTPQTFGEGAQTVALSLVPRTVTFTVALVPPAGRDYTCPAVTGWELYAGDGVGSGGDRNLFIHVTQDSPVVTIDPSRLENSDATQPFTVFYRFVAAGHYGEVNEGDSAYAPLVVKRATRFTDFSASPKPVVQGDQILLKATLQRANWESDVWSAYAGRHLSYQNRDAAGGPYTLRYAFHQIVTNNTGIATLSVRSDITRYHRFVFDGNSAAGASKPKGVKVVVTT